MLDFDRRQLYHGATITNTGTIDVTGGTLTIDATSTLDNTSGTLETNGGNLIIDAAIGGNLEIKGGAVLELGSSLASAYSKVTVTFEPGSTGTLKLDHSETFGGAVAGLDDNRDRSRRHRLRIEPDCQLCRGCLRWYSFGLCRRG